MLSMFALSACEKAYLTSKEVVITTPVSFSADIIPIFTADCSTPTCHLDGGPPPNLTPTKAYDELQLGLVDTSNAKDSKLYKLCISTDPNTRMPKFPEPPLSAEKIGYILAWIEQGAQNN